MLLVLAALQGACQEQTKEERYPLRGKVVSVDPAQKSVTVDHEEVEGLMPGMVMPFPVKDEWAFESLAPGDGLGATLVVQEGGGRKKFWLQDLVITRSEPSAASPVEPPRSRIGELAPDVELLNQDGRRFRLSERRGRALLVTFIYTRCPLVDFCPRMTHQFAALEERLRQEPALYERTRLLTVSFDPEHDTPEKLKAYAGSLGIASPPADHWEFATGDPKAVEELSTFFGLEYRAEPSEIVHNLRTGLLAPDGTLKEIYRGNQWPVGEVLDDVRELLGPT
jgi:protein SCO1/2